MVVTRFVVGLMPKFMERNNPLTFFILIASIFICSCSTDYRLAFSEKSYLDYQKSEEIYLAGPLDLEVDSSHIYVSNYKSDSLLWLFDKSSLDNIGKFLPHGIGPSEFSGPIQFFIKDSLLTVHNRWHYEVKELEIKHGRVKFIESPVTYRISTDIDMLCPLSDSTFVATGRFSDARFAIIDRKRIIDYFGDYPSYKEGEENIPNFPKFMFHQSRISYNPIRKFLLAVSGHVMDIWSMEGKPTLYKRVLLSDYDYEFDSGEDWASAKELPRYDYGTVKIYTTLNRIYLLYNPNSVESHQKSEETLNNEIWVFDWNGTEIEKYISDQRIVSFCVDEENSSVFAIIQNPEYSICEYKIKQKK